MVSPAREQLNHFYEQNTGYITKETMQPYEKITKELKKIEENRAKASGKSLKEADDIYESYEATRAMALKLEERLNYAEKLEKQGIDGWWLNETGYRWLFGKGNVSDRMVHGALGNTCHDIYVVRMLCYGEAVRCPLYSAVYKKRQEELFLTKGSLCGNYGGIYLWSDCWSGDL